MCSSDHPVCIPISRPSCVKIFSNEFRPCRTPDSLWATNLYSLLRLVSTAKWKEQSSGNQTKYQGFLTVVSCLLPSAYLHFTTIFARARSCGGMVMPSCLAVCKLIASSTLSTVSIFISFGDAPLRTCWTYLAERRPISR